jgi:hypothetical protein
VRQERGGWSGGVLEWWSGGVVECWSGGVVVRKDGLESQPPLRYSYANFLSRGCGGGIRVGGEQPFGEHREVFSYSGS